MNNWENEYYYCDGICEKCNFGKVYKNSQGEYCTCDTKKIDITKVVCPLPPEINKR